MSTDYTRIETKEEFLRLVAKLAADRDSKTWANSSAPDFVEALGRWLEDADGFYHNAGRTMDTSQPSWQLFADMLQAARIYE
jgi:hypothetical protein